MTTIAPTLAFFGSTGGCLNTCLAHTLKAGYNASALSRSSSKLSSALLEQGVPQSTIDEHLTIIQGDARDVAAIKRTLMPLGEDGPIVSTIISGIGAVGKLQASLLHPIKFENPNICTELIRTLLSALGELKAAGVFKSTQKPLLSFISTTGISKPRAPEDVPIGFRILYHQFLATPHKDKRIMEDLIRSHMEKPANEQLFRGYVGVRPSLLVGGSNVKDGNGLKAVRTGTEQNPALGYTIKRPDVGEWIFQEVIKTGGEGLEGEMITLTY